MNPSTPGPAVPPEAQEITAGPIAPPNPLAVTRVKSGPRSQESRCARAPWFLLVLAALFILPRLHSTTPWHVPVVAPAPSYAGQGIPDLTGTWQGVFGRGDRPGLLVVTWQDGPSFDGVLYSRDGGTYRVGFHGFITPGGWVYLQETRTLSTPFLGAWALGTDKGFLSPDSLAMVGRGWDVAGSHYGFAFTHRSSLIYLPKD